MEKDLKDEILLADEDTNLDNPVNLKTFEQVKSIRAKLKEKNASWVNDFRRAHQRDPFKQDYEEIKEDVKEFNFYNKKYQLMKAKMVRQDQYEVNFAKEEVPASARGEGGDEPMQRRMTMTGMKFGAGITNAANNTKGFAAFAEAGVIGDPSLKKMKEEIGQKEVQNQELNDEIKRLKYRLEQNVGDKDMFKDLMKELKIKEDQMQGRDVEIDALIIEKNDIEIQKQELMKQIEEMKTAKLVERKNTILQR